jgi:predicted O-methyltransferase YrrM
MDVRVEEVLRALEARSRRELTELEVLRRRGGTALRERAASFMLDVGPEVGRLLNLLVRAMGATTVVEVGGSVGYSTLWLAEALRETEGTLYSVEVDAGKQMEQAANLDAAGLRAVVEQTAVEVPGLVAGLPAPIDLVLLDHWKELYVRDFDACWPFVRRGGLVVADNILVPAKNASLIARYHDNIARHPDARTLTLSLGDGVELTTKTGHPTR